MYQKIPRRKAGVKKPWHKRSYSERYGSSRPDGKSRGAMAEVEERTDKPLEPPPAK